jgi:hypothetical protein
MNEYTHSLAQSVLDAVWLTIVQFVRRRLAIIWGILPLACQAVPVHHVFTVFTFVRNLTTGHTKFCFWQNRFWCDRISGQAWRQNCLNE